MKKKREIELNETRNMNLSQTDDGCWIELNWLNWAKSGGLVNKENANDENAL